MITMFKNDIRITRKEDVLLHVESESTSLGVVEMVYLQFGDIISSVYLGNNSWCDISMVKNYEFDEFGITLIF